MASKRFQLNLSLFRLSLAERGFTKSVGSICRSVASLLSPARALPVIFTLCSMVTNAQTAHVSGVQTVLNLPSALDYPQSVAVDAGGSIYIADAYNSRVLKLMPVAGGYSQSTVGTGLVYPYGVAVDASGNVYIADIELTKLLKETPSSNGYTQSTIGSNLYDAVSVAVDVHGNVFAVEVNNSFIGTLVKETLSGGVYTQSFIPVPGSHGVFSVAVDSNDNLFLDDAWDGQVFEDSLINGNYFTSTLLDSAGAVAVDANNNVYIASYADYIVKLTPSGSSFTTSYLPTNGTNTPYGYFGPGGMAVDGNGNIFFDDLYTYVLVELSQSAGNFGRVNVGVPSGDTSVFFTFDAPDEVGRVAVVTQGSSSLTDFNSFSDGGTDYCYAQEFYSTNDSCYVNVYFQPTAAGDRLGAAVLYDANGVNIATGYVYGVGVGPQVTFADTTNAADFAPTLQTVMGNNFITPLGAAVDASGNIFVADSGNSEVKEIVAQGGFATINVLGSGFGDPSAVAVDGAGNVFVADTGNNSVKQILAASGYTTVNTLASGFSGPRGVAVDGSGNVFVADTGNSEVKELVAASGYMAVNTLGSGFAGPSGVAVDAADDVFVADTNNNAVKEILALGGYTTVNAIGSGFGHPHGVALDASGNVYVGDYGNNAVKEVLTAGGYTAVNTLGAGYLDPAGVAVDASGDVLIADSGSNSIVKLDYTDAPTLNFAATKVGSASSDSPQTVTISNIGTAALTYTAAGNNVSASGSPFTLGSPANPCAPLTSVSTVLTLGTSCNYTVDFTPTAAVAYSPANSSVVLTEVIPTQAGPVLTIGLSGNGLSNTAAAQTITFNPAVTTYSYSAGGGFGLAATTSSGLAVSFASTTPTICTVVANTATIVSVGMCTIEATQSGNANFFPAPPVLKNFTIGAGQQTITFNPAVTTYPYSHLGTFALAASASSGLPVSFATETGAVCTVAGNTATILTGGLCKVKATQNGNLDYPAAPVVVENFTISLLAQTITFAPLPGQVVLGSAPLALSATGGLSGNPVTFKVIAGPGAIVNGNTLKINGLGTIDVAANEAGNVDYLAAPQVVQAVIVSQFLAPAIATEAAASVSNTSETLSAQVNPNGAATEYCFEWGLTQNTVTNLTAIKVIAAGAAPVQVNTILNGLQPNTKYYYRLVAKSAGGETVGPTQSFTTQ